MSLLAIASTVLAAVASSAGEAAGAGDGAAPLEAGAAPLLSPLAMVALGVGLVGVAMLRTKLRDSSTE